MDKSGSAEEENKLPLKRVELSLSKFNEVAIPHHLDLLRQHKANIIKHSEAGEYRRVRAEQSAARRAAARLRALLAELEALRRAVRPQDRPAFDALAARAVRDTRDAIADYRDVIESGCRALVEWSDARRPLSARGAESSPMMMRRAGAGAASVEAGGADGGAGSVTSSESVGVVREGEGGVQLQVDEVSLALREREEALRGWGELQEEVRALHATWLAVHEAARAQREDAARAGERVDAAAEQVGAARAHLALGERLRGAGGAAGGAALGALAGGPVGLLVGLKAGAAAALAGSLLGYAAGRLLPRRALAPVPAPEPPRDKDKAA